VKAAVESALLQGHPSKEVIVVDDASPDGTADVLSTFGESITLAKLSVNGGAAAARNHGASLARGRFLAFLDGDDILMPWALDVYARLIAAHSPKIILGRSATFLASDEVLTSQAFQVHSHLISSHRSNLIPERSAINDGKSAAFKTEGLPCDIRFVVYPNFFAKDRPCVFNSSTVIIDRSTFWSQGGWSPVIFCQDMQDLLTKLGGSGKVVLVLAPDTVWYRIHLTNAIHKVSPFIEGIYVLLKKAKAGFYPGGRKLWIARSSWFGGLIFYWLKTAMRAGLYREALALLAKGWWMILLAIIRRGTAFMVGRRPIEILPLEHG